MEKEFKFLEKNENAPEFRHYSDENPIMLKSIAVVAIIQHTHHSSTS